MDDIIKENIEKYEKLLTGIKEVSIKNNILKSSLLWAMVDYCDKEFKAYARLKFAQYNNTGKLSDHKSLFHNNLAYESVSSIVDKCCKIDNYTAIKCESGDVEEEFVHTFATAYEMVLEDISCIIDVKNKYFMALAPIYLTMLMLYVGKNGFSSITDKTIYFNDADGFNETYHQENQSRDISTLIRLLFDYNEPAIKGLSPSTKIMSREIRNACGMRIAQKQCEIFDIYRNMIEVIPNANITLSSLLLHKQTKILGKIVNLNTPSYETFPYGFRNTDEEILHIVEVIKNKILSDNETCYRYFERLGEYDCFCEQFKSAFSTTEYLQYISMAVKEKHYNKNVEDSMKEHEFYDRRSKGKGTISSYFEERVFEDYQFLLQLSSWRSKYSSWEESEKDYRIKYCYFSPQIKSNSSIYKKSILVRKEESEIDVKAVQRAEEWLAEIDENNNRRRKPLVKLEDFVGSDDEDEDE